MGSGAARTRRRSARQTGRAASVAAWVTKNVSEADWIVLAACGVAAMLALQNLQGRVIDYDEGVYWQSLRAMANDHPLFASVFSSQPPLFLLSVFPFYVIFGQSLIAARLAVVVFSLAGLIGTYVIGRALGHRAIGGVACLLLALDPLYERAAHTLQAEMPSIALQIWAVALAALAMKASGRASGGWLAAGAGILLGSALLMKLFAVVALVPIVLYLSAPFAGHMLDDKGHLKLPPWKMIQDDLGQITLRLALLAAGLLGVTLLMLLPFVGQLDAAYDQVVRFHLAAIHTSSRPLHENLRLIGETLLAAPNFYIAALAVPMIVWRRLWASVPLAFWALAAFVLLVLQQPLFAHHVVLLSPALALVAGYGVFAAWQALASTGRQRAGLAIALILLVLAGGAGLAINLQRKNVPPKARELEMAVALQSVSAPHEAVVTDNQYVAALADRDVLPQLVDTSRVRIESGYLTSAQLQELITRNRVRVILFAAGRFDELPGFRAWVEQHYAQVATFGRRRRLFVLAPNTPHDF